MNRELNNSTNSNDVHDLSRVRTVQDSSRARTVQASSQAETVQETSRAGTASWWRDQVRKRVLVLSAAALVGAFAPVGFGGLASHALPANGVACTVTDPGFD